MTDTFPPLRMRWTGDSFVPAHPKTADRYLVVDQDYVIVEHHERSAKSHNHYFASIKEVWDNLNDDQRIRHPTPEHLRAWALIKAGFHDQRSIVCASKAEAERVRAFINRMDDYAVVVARDAVVVVYTAKSQKLRAMGKDEFQRSKESVLGVLSDLIGVSKTELQQNAGRAA